MPASFRVYPAQNPRDTGRTRDDAGRVQNNAGRVRDIPGRVLYDRHWMVVNMGAEWLHEGEGWRAIWDKFRICRKIFD
jgi:hypothetical protein